ncbi:transmembrane 7 superfamily member 3 isoform X2 [Brienomyrus brachyistius]|uniref:transmembrane 7 superfamily member 3 isoform X2 n=1 Tax=Brienomyrus brachyistius TaxID=42636 RepID=UPI0020B3AC5F|nr:transmembrane 7 superfamily member 3 isoform X2 [Brienomyrus brachyistius]
MKRRKKMPQLWKAFSFLLVMCNGVVAQTANRVIFSLGTFQNVTVPGNATVEVQVSGIPVEVSYITFQFHTWRHNITLSYTEVPALGSSHTATDAGLLSLMLRSQTSLTWYLLPSDSAPLTAVGVVLPYRGGDPVPGGCNLENGVNFDPSIHLRYTVFETTITVAAANVGYARGASPPSCNATGGPQTRLEYDVYQYLLRAGDLSEESLLIHIQKVADAGGVTSHGTKGVIYSVVVRDPMLNTSALYVPVHSYACSFSSALDGCMTLGKISTKVFFTVVGLAGLCVCFFGHRFFKCELFWMGLCFAASIFYVIITKTTTLDYDLRLALTSLMGLVGGVLLVMSWWRLGSILCCVGVVGLLLGFLLAASVFFTPVGSLSVFQSDAAFRLTFGTILLAAPLVFLRWPREGSIVCCGVVGSYSVLLAVSTYISTSLSYLTLDVLKRLVDGSFSRTSAAVAFRSIDYILLTVWVILAVGGTALQLHRERERPFFPPSPYLMWRQERERRKTNVLDPSHHMPPLPSRLQGRLLGLIRRKEPAEERTPLLL